MPTVSMPPVEEAKEVFDDLGYTVDGDGPNLRARRKWRTVHVTAVADDPHPIATDGGHEDIRLRCFVTWKESVATLRERLSGLDLGYEWAIIGVTEDGGYRVVRDDAAPAA